MQLTFILSGFSHWEPKKTYPRIWVLCTRARTPTLCPLSCLPTEAQESSLLEERQPPGATGTMAGGQLGEAPRLPPPGLPVAEHPQVSTPPALPGHHPAALGILGTWAFSGPGPSVPVLEGVGRH